MVEGPGVVTGRSGTIGRVHFVENDYWPHNTSLWVTSFRGNDPKFIYYLYSHVGLTKMLSGSGVPTLNRNDVHQYIVAYPSFAEQRAIAEALSDVDGLLAALEDLTVKKRAIKQAAMQQLLTGRVRLPGLTGQWQPLLLGQAADIRNGATPKTHIASFWNGSIPWCTPTDITSNSGKYLLDTDRRITAEGLADCGASLLPAGALLLCSRATVGEIKIALFPVCTNQGFKSLVCREDICNEFLYYFLLSVKARLIERATGSIFLEIRKHDIASIELEIPSFDEQRAIAAVLSDMDSEVEALERRRDKVRAVKQGMMEQLLTGRVRLV